MTPFIPKGTLVQSRAGGERRGVATGTTRLCTGGCTGVRVYVKWPEGHTTYPCSKGMEENEDGSWRIV